MDVLENERIRHVVIKEVPIRFLVAIDLPKTVIRYEKRRGIVERGFKVGKS